jgi:HlyD family secretion protein
MTRARKIGLGVGGAVVAVVGTLIGIHEARKGIVAVQIGHVARQDLTSMVTASGEIRPKTYTNVYAEGFGKITEIAVQEGDSVRRGDLLLRLENIQPAADVAAQEAAEASARAAGRAAEAGYRSAQALIKQRQADFEKARFDWERAQQLFAAHLISRQDYDASKATFQSAQAALAVSQAQLQQALAQRQQARANLGQTEALVRRAQDVLRKTTYTAPINGLVTYIAVRVGESVVPGIQNSPGSYLMTISDMSVVTAEVKVDETDIVSVRDGQSTDLSIDALPNQAFTGKVTEVGTQAILRSSGLATSQVTTGTEEAKDFKVVVTLDRPPAGLRPGLSVTAKIKTAHRSNTLTIPIQALVIRTRKQLKEAQQSGGKGSEVTLAASASPSEGGGAAGDEVQGVFVIRNGKAVFVPVKTGITGVSDIEITSGLNQGDEIITGSYQVLRTIRPGASVKVEKTPSGQEAEKG